MKHFPVAGKSFSGKPFSASLKIIIPLYITYGLFVLSVFAVFLPMMKTHMMNQKKEMIQGLTESTASLLAGYHQRVENGDLTIEEAKQRAINRIRHLRYGINGKDYFWISDMQQRVIMHPYVPELEGVDQTDFADTTGKYPFVEFARTVEKEGQGYVEYLWQWNDVPGLVVPKISYVKGFSPWGWVLGTGLYLDDINREITVITRGFVKIFLGVLVVVILMSFYITWQTVRVEKLRQQAETARHFEELRLKKLLELSRMSDASLDSLVAFALEEAIFLTQSNIGFVAFLDDTETCLTMHTWSKHAMDQCDIEDKSLTYRLEDTGLWTQAIRERDTVIINDYEHLESLTKKGCPQGHVSISRFMSVPVFDGSRIKVLAGVGNKKDDYDESDARQLKLMMDGMWTIIQKKQAQDRLRESEERYRLLADNATDVIWVLQLSDFTLSYISPSVETTLGYSPEEMTSMKKEEIMTPVSLRNGLDLVQEELEIDIDEAGGDSHYRVLELELVRKDEKRIWTETTACFLRDENGKLDRVLGNTRDITERVNLEKRMRQAQKMEALGTLAGGIAHDFNNILSSVLGFAELVKMDIPENEEIRNNLDQILAAGIRARDLVGHILTFSRRADVQKHLLQIEPLIKECIKFIKASTSATIEIKHQFAESCGLVMADPTQIHQVLMNLFTNAIYAMKNKGGILDVRLRTVTLVGGEMLQGRDLKPGRYIQLTVSDTGCGIPHDVIGRIFEPFFTTKGIGEGTGMGLSTVYGIIRDMEGAISVYSESGTGATFQIMLPEHQGESGKNEPLVDLMSLAGEGRILLVDDEVSIVNWTLQVLNRLGYKAVSVTDSRQALDRFKQSPDRFDLVITDLTMPHMTGLELAGRMTVIRPDLPIILCTGFSEGVSPEILKENRISDMIMKPMIASELAQAVRNALKSKTEAGEKA